MIDGLKPYPQYKDSGLPWLGRIPKHWDLKRGKSLFKRVDERSVDGREELLTVSSARGVVPRSTAQVTMFKAESYKGYKLCWPGDLAINSLWAWGGGLGVSKHHGIISSAYGVYRLRRDAPIIPDFVHEVVRSSPFQWELQVRSKGIWTSRLQLTDESFLDAPFYLPPRDEQTAIVRFLDYASARIEGAIRAKRKLIALLTEQKQATIHRSLTRGLDPTVARKSSGVSWLGDIPKHWQVRRLKHVVRLNPSKTEISHDMDNTAVTFLPMEHVSAHGEINRTTTIQVGKARSSFTYIRDGDVIIAKITPCFENGKGALCSGLQGGIAFGSTEFHVLRLSANIIGAYLYLLTQDPVVRQMGEKSMSGSAGQKRVPRDFFANLRVPCPSLLEQHAIVEGIKRESAPWEIALARTEQEISLLREYRTRLVADVVTGKLDVRAVASHLPDEPKESEPTSDEIEPEEEQAEIEPATSAELQ